MEPNAVLRHIHKIIVDYRIKSGILVGKFATQAGLKKNALGSIEEEKLTDKGRLSTIDLWSLVKILITYPALKMEIADYLSRNTDKNITEEQKTMENPEFEIAVVKRMMEMLDEKKTELQRKYDKLESEMDGLRMENNSLREQLKNCSSANNKSK